MTILLAAVDAGSMSAAARRLGIPVQTASRKLAELERQVGATLLARTTRKLALTEAGAGYAAAARRIVQAVEDAEREAIGEFVAPRGELVIAAPLFFGRLHVVPIVADFLGCFPAIDVRLVLGDRNVDLLGDGVDMAVRIGELTDGAVIATRVGAMRAVVAAAPRLLAAHVTPTTPASLHELPCISLDGPAASAAWRFRDPDTGRIETMSFAPRLVTTAEAAVEAAICGVGVIRSLHYQVAEAVAAGRLRLMLEPFETEPLPVHLVHAPRGELPLKMRRFLDTAAPRLRRILRALASDTMTAAPRVAPSA